MVRKIVQTLRRTLLSAPKCRVTATKAIKCEGRKACTVGWSRPQRFRQTEGSSVWSPETPPFPWQVCQSGPLHTATGQVCRGEEGRPQYSATLNVYDGVQHHERLRGEDAENVSSPFSVLLNSMLFPHVFKCGCRRAKHAFKGIMPMFRFIVNYRIRVSARKCLQA